MNRDTTLTPTAPEADTGAATTDENCAPATAPDTTEGPPKVYIAACGGLVDIFWWARRRRADSSTPDRT